MAVVGNALGNLAFMMGEFKVHPTAVDIKRFSEIFLTHRGAFEMPSGETVAPRRRPPHYMLRLCLFP